MAVDLTQNNYGLVRAAWTAMDQGYSTLQKDDVLHPVDNSGQGRTQPFAVPEGFVVREVVQDAATGAQVAIYYNQTTGDILLNPMGTNGWEASQWQDNMFGSMGKTAWEGVADQVFAVADSLLGAGAQRITWSGDSRGAAIAQWGMYDLADKMDRNQLASLSNLASFDKGNMAGVFRNGPGVGWLMSSEEAARAKSLLADVTCDISADRTGGSAETVSKTGGDYLCGDGTVNYFDAGNGNIDPLAKHRLVDNGWSWAAANGGDFGERVQSVRELLPIETATAIGRLCASLGDDPNVSTTPEALTRIFMGLMCSFTLSPPGSAYQIVQEGTEGYLGEFGSTVLGIGGELAKWLKWPIGLALTAVTTTIGVPVAKVFESGTPANGLPAPLSLDQAVRETGAPQLNDSTNRYAGRDALGNTQVIDVGFDEVRIYTFDGFSKSAETIYDDGRYNRTVGALEYIRNADGGGVVRLSLGDEVHAVVVEKGVDVRLKHGGDATPTDYFEMTWQASDSSHSKLTVSSNGTWTSEKTDSYGSLLSGQSGAFNLGAPTTSTFTLSTNPDPGNSEITPPSGITEGTLIATGTYALYGDNDVNTATGNRQAAYAVCTADWRPGANEVLAFDYWATGGTDYLDFQFFDYQGAYTNQQATGATQWTPVDPLILDLNGDGVILTSVAEAPVLFDIDHDGPSAGAGPVTKEVTGWVSAEDGIVVMDLDNNGLIDGIHETMSEYFDGAVGTGGEAGEKKYANGFAALKSLDTGDGAVDSAGYGDDSFTAADAAWINVKVWVDANHDGITDTDELKTLDELGITSINLSPTSQSGLVNGGNEVLATGTFIQNGLNRQAQAARFIANPIGNSSYISSTGTAISAQDGQSTYVSSVTAGETIDVAAVVGDSLGTLGVRNAYGNIGNDVLTGDDNANWLVGGQGSDTFNAGAGDDMLIIDGADLQSNIHAGDGFDMLQVVGTGGVTLNLAQAEVEIVVGGTGDDILIGGGRSSVFIRAGDGDDIIIGGAANDALSGENGADLIDGGAGNDVIHGGRGQDQLMGGAGDDLVFGGQDDDRLSGGAGNDVLKGELGDDMIDGGDGTDIAEYSGSFADYRITKLTDTTYRIVDSKSGRDGADMLTNIEKLNFADISAFNITQDHPFPVKDILTIDNREGLKLIKVADLLANDRDWQGDALHITTLSDIKGGTVAGTYNAGTQDWTPTLTANGELQFTPDPAYTGLMSFKYKIADVGGASGAWVEFSDTQIPAEIRGQVFITTPEMPTDTLFTDQWYLSDINVLPVWQDAYGQGYTGKGVRIAQFEPGGEFSTGPVVFDYRNADLQANVDLNWIGDADNNIPQSFSQHATLVAGVMTAARNGEGAVGIAYDAKLSGHYIGPTEVNYLAQFKYYDVVNNSWGADENFGGFSSGGMLIEFQDAVEQGRKGLGTVIVMAAGNSREDGANTNASVLTDNRATITVGAINAQTDVSTLVNYSAPFSTPGASILVSAPGSNISSTSSILMNDAGTVFGSDTETVKGTSLAAPIISGIVALMLEANPNLGWRDVQQILAISARQVNDPYTDQANRDQAVDLNSSQFWNRAGNWNGGAMHTSHDYGFGDVDARAAVRLAESWIGTHNSDNERRLQSAEGSLEKKTNFGNYIVPDRKPLFFK